MPSFGRGIGPISRNNGTRCDGTIMYCIPILHKDIKWAAFQSDQVRVSWGSGDGGSEAAGAGSRRQIMFVLRKKEKKRKEKERASEDGPTYTDREKRKEEDI